jgi:hypothetical protein
MWPARSASARAARSLSSSRSRSSSASFSGVTSRVKHCVFLNTPSSKRTQELISTWRIEPSLHRRRAA